MEIQFHCSNCQTKYSAKIDQSGKEGQCKNCDAKITVPQLISETVEVESGSKSNDKHDSEPDRKLPKMKDLRMNNKQRYLLITAGIALAVVLLLTPQYRVLNGVKFPPDLSGQTYNQYDYVTAIIRCFVVIAVTFSAYLLFKSKE